MNFNDYDTTGIQRINKEQDIVYTAIDIDQEGEGFDVNIKVPAFNINNQVASSFNTTTEVNFIEKARQALANTDANNKCFYSIEYAGFVNGNILSIVIQVKMKQGSRAQSVLMQTYNYNLETEEEASLTDLITMKALNKEDVNKEIRRVVQEADEAAKAVQEMTDENIYMRDLENEMYTVDGSTTYFLGPDNSLYIIYPYGNYGLTSEMDVVLFE